MKPDVIWKRIIQILAICQIGIEVFQLYQRTFAYLTNWENWIDCFIYSTALLTVYDFTECSSTSGVRLNWQWLLAALCIFFGWINLLFMVRKMPRFGIFVVMFVDIVKTFFRFFPVFVLFIIAFSSSFYVILQNRVSCQLKGYCLILSYLPARILNDIPFTSQNNCDDDWRI